METTHKVCEYIRRIEANASGRKHEPCQLCHSIVATQYGDAYPGCRMLADEVTNIVLTGNPWGKPGIEWPPNAALSGTTG